jgi:formate dehydrogenase accessory protein FdhD
MKSIYTRRLAVAGSRKASYSSIARRLAGHSRVGPAKGGQDWRAITRSLHGFQHHPGARRHALSDVRRRAKRRFESRQTDPGKTRRIALRRRAGKAAQVKALVNMVMNINTAGLGRRPWAGRCAGAGPYDAARSFLADGRQFARAPDRRRGHAKSRPQLLLFRRARRQGFRHRLRLAREQGLNLPLAAATKKQFDEQLVSIASHPRNKDRNVIGVFLADDVELDLKRFERHTFVSSSCGLCGKNSIDSVRLQFPPIQSRCRIDAALLMQLPEKLRAHQTEFSRTGGLHAAGVFDLNGNLIVSREDIGRHNAVDKVLGYGLLNGLLPYDRHVLIVSGRASFEIMQKALAGRAPIIAAVSAPSSLAVEFAKASRQTLAGFLRGDRMNVYSEAKRIA